LLILSLINNEANKVDKAVVKKKIISLIEGLLEGNTEEITGDTQLVGGNTMLDSMKLVEVCLELEDLAEENGFEFDWTSETAMSKSRGMFRTIDALTNEFVNQMRSES